MAPRALAWKRNGHDRVFHRSENGAFTFLAGGQEPFHRDVAQAARGHVGDSQQAHVVMRIEERLEIGDEILESRAGRKSSDRQSDGSARSACRERGFQRRATGDWCGTRIACSPHVALWVVPGIFNLFDHSARLRFIVGESVQR